MIPRPFDLVVSKWGARYRGQNFPCSLGRGGIGEKRGEGDGITPEGCWRVASVMYRADRLALSRPASIIGPGHIWSDDPNDPEYNHLITARDHPFSAERLFRSDPLYDLVAILDFNWPDAVVGAGSAIFLHTWRAPRHPTAGCVAFAPDVLRFILKTWDARGRVIIRA